MQVFSETAPPEPELRRWTRDEFYRMADLGWFRGQHVQLIDGEVVVMSPQKWSHASTIDRVAKALDRAAEGHAVWVRTQLPLALGPHSEPEPDVSVVAGARDEYSDHPTTALLVVEVSDSSLEFDRSRKASLYASAPIGEYWIVNLIDHCVEVFRQPLVDAAQPLDSRYASHISVEAGDSVSVPFAPQARINVADLLPPA
jgi:Uma2 family endonuclease